MTATAQTLGPLPEWNLADLYASPEDPKFEADMKTGEDLARAFAEKYRGKLASLGGAGLAAALKDYEAMSDLLGRTGSYAQLYYVGDTTDSQRGKFYGDVSARLTEISTMLLFFELEMNRIDDAAMSEAMKVPALAHYRPWIDNLRMEKPYQLDDKLEELFLEKSQTSSAAFNRLFDETMAGLRFEVDGEKLSLEPTLNMMQSPDEAVRRKGADALARTFGENVKLFTLITNTLAKDKEISDRWRGFKDISDARHLSNRVEPEVVAALVESVAAQLREDLAPLLQDEGEVAGQGPADALGPQCAAALGRYARGAVGRGAGDGVVGLRTICARDGVDRQDLLRQALDRRAVAPRQGAGRLRAPDRALGAPLRAAELPGQDAGRDDAGP